MASGSKPPIDFMAIMTRVWREAESRRAADREVAAAAVAKAPAGATIVLRESRKSDKHAGTLVDIEAVADGGRVTLLAAYESDVATVLPPVLAFARLGGAVVECRQGQSLAHRFDPGLPLMVRPSQSLDEALAVLERAGHRISRAGDTITIARDVRRRVTWPWILTVLFLPFAILWWLFFLFALGREALREDLVRRYVPGIASTEQISVAPWRLGIHRGHLDRGQILAIVPAGSTIGVVWREGYARLEGLAINELECAAVADVLLQVLAEAVDDAPDAGVAARLTEERARGPRRAEAGCRPRGSRRRWRGGGPPGAP